MERSSSVFPTPEGPCRATHSPSCKSNEAEMWKRLSPLTVSMTSKLTPQTIYNPPSDLCRRLVGVRKHGADIDLAEHVTVAPVVLDGTKHEVGVPDHRQVMSRNLQ